MNKCFCDRCHQVIKERKTLRWNYVRLFMEDDLDKYYDICPKCYKEIETFIKHPLEYEAKMLLKIRKMEEKNI